MCLGLKALLGDHEIVTVPVVVDSLPTSGSHRPRTVEYMPDGRMVVSAGSSCNAYEEADPHQEAVLVYDGPHGTGERLYPRGLRNAVGLAIDPDGALYVSDDKGGFVNRISYHGSGR